MKLFRKSILQPLVNGTPIYKCRICFFESKEGPDIKGRTDSYLNIVNSYKHFFEKHFQPTFSLYHGLTCMFKYC
jgi:hypothetical protein